MEEDFWDELLEEETLWTLERQLFAPKIIIPQPQKMKEVRQLQEELQRLLCNGSENKKIIAGFSERNPHCAMLSFRIKDIEDEKVRNFVEILEKCIFLGTRTDGEDVHMELLIPDVCKVTFLDVKDNE